jgi:RNAse (barnase) inhibitor barstar
VTDTLQKLIESGNGGVFRWHGGRLRSPLLPGFIQVVVDLEPVRDRKVFFEKMAGALAFPGHFGHNLDAFYDCLADLAEGVEAGLLLVLEGASGFARAEPEEFGAAVDVLRDAADDWKGKGKVLLAVIQLEQPVLAPDLPEISAR